jgi:hypothetical protein
MSLSEFRNVSTVTSQNALSAHKLRKRRTKVIVGILLSTLALLIILTSSILPLPSLAMATANGDDNSIKMTKQQSFIDANGKLNVVGVVDNNGKIPISVTVSLNTIDKSSGMTRTLIDPTFGNIIYPYTGAPFKFIIDPNQQSVKGTAFISSVKQIPVPYYNVIRLNYSNIPTGSNKALVGTAQNIGPFDLHDLTVYASVHDRNGFQIDSIRSNVMHLIKPGQQAHFIALPDSVVAPNAVLISCAGVSLGNDPMNALDIGNGQSILYDINGVLRISDFKYSAANDSIMFQAKHYNPSGGPMSLKLVKNSGGSDVIVMMDGKVYNNGNNNAASIKMMNTKTVHIDLFIPPGDHTLQIKGIRSTT